MVVLHPVQFFVGLFTLIVFSIMDIKMLEVHNKPILYFVIISTLLSATLNTFFGYNFFDMLIGIVITFFVCFTLVKIKWFGGADYKILIGLALLTNKQFMLPYLVNMFIITLPVAWIVTIFREPLSNMITIIEHKDKTLSYPFVPILLLTFLLTVKFDNIIINLIR